MLWLLVFSSPVLTASQVSTYNLQADVHYFNIKYSKQIGHSRELLQYNPTSHPVL